MSTVIMYYDAKCKHCIHFKYKKKLNKNGEKSKISRAYCGNDKSIYFNTSLTLQSKGCDKLEL